MLIPYTGPMPKLRTRLPEGYACLLKFCHEPATYRLQSRRGGRFVPVCRDHLNWLAVKTMRQGPDECLMLVA